MAKELYITIAGIDNYFGMRPFKVALLLTLKKDRGNSHDDEAIEVIAPLLGRVGYVANSSYTTVAGTISAGRLYDRIPNECVAVVRFISEDKIIARVFPDKKLDVRVRLRLEDLAPKENSHSNIKSEFVLKSNSTEQ